MTFTQAVFAYFCFQFGTTAALIVRGPEPGSEGMRLLRVLWMIFELSMAVWAWRLM